MQAAVIADIVGSRRLADRAAGQRALDATIARVDADFPTALASLRPVVGDEQQGLYPDLNAALAATLLLRLALPDEVDLRFGIGLGEVTTVASAAGDIPEGPGWWAAREAIDIVHGLQKRTAPSARTWAVAAAGEDGGMERSVRVANAYLLVRDQVVTTMTSRARRLAYGRCRGRTQAELARGEGISQSAVSQSLATAGAPALLEGYLALTDGSAP